MRYKLTEFHPLQPDIAMDKQSLVSKLSLVSSEEGVTTYEGKATITIWLEGWDRLYRWHHKRSNCDPT